jgi:hypothetical protein
MTEPHAELNADAPQAVDGDGDAPARKPRTRTRARTRVRTMGASSRARSQVVNAIDAEALKALPRYLENMRKLADGGYEQVEVKWGRPPRKKKADGDEAPELAPEQTPDEYGNIVLGRTISYAAPDRAANQYLIDRVLGRTAASAPLPPRVEPPASTVPDAFLVALEKAYGPAREAEATDANSVE